MENCVLVLDTEKQPNIPTQFVFPHEAAHDELEEPSVDLKGFFNGDEEATQLAATQIRIACLKHGFFQVVNHGVDASIVREAQKQSDAFFNLPLAKKLDVQRKPGSFCGYSQAHAERFSSNLPWKETFSLTYQHSNGHPGLDVVNYFKSVLGQNFEEAGYAYQKYCEAMEKLCLAILEVIAISLGVDRLELRKYFEDGMSIMRANNYPACREAGSVLGTGPHCDPNSLTILHQDDVGGLEVFSDNKWRVIKPVPDAFVVNIGDTFMALCNGRYKSCLHRAVVNKERVRRSLVFFVNPKCDKIVRPPKDLIQEPRQYPDFTWSDLREFALHHYRVDETTFPNFIHWLSLQHKTQLP